MKRPFWLIFLVITVGPVACARADRETPVAPPVAQVTAPSTPTTAPSEPPTPSFTPIRPLTPTVTVTEAAFVSVLPTPIPTPTFTPSPTPWPTLTPLPAASPATPVLVGLPPLGVDWIQPVGYWHDNWGRGREPVALQRDGILVVGGIGRQPVMAFSSEDGQVLWRYPTDLEPSSPYQISGSVAKIVMTNDLVILDTTQRIVAISAVDGQMVWYMETRGRQGLAAASDDTIYLRDFVPDPPELVAVNPRYHPDRWHYECRSDFYDEILATPESVFVVCQDVDGRATIVQHAAQTGELLRELSGQDPGLDLLGFKQGILFVGAPAFGSRSNFELSDNAYQVNALDWSSGQPLWQIYLAGQNAIKLESDDILINAGNQLQRLSISDGKSQWITTLPVDDHGLRLNHTVRDGENLLIGSDSGFLYVFDWQTGDLLWMGDLSGQLGLPWRPVTPLGVEGDMILVWISLADGDAVAGLRRGASPAPWPTPTFVPDSALQMPAPTVAPTPSGTPVPADWTPEPVQWDPSNTSEIPRVEREMRDQLLTWLNLHPGDYEEFNRQVSQWPSRPYAGEGTFAFPPDYVSWVHNADLDNDGNQEDIIAFGVRLKTWAVLENKGQQTYIVYASEPNPNYLGATPEFVLADDINCDGLVETVVQWRGSGTWGDFINAYVYQWDGSTWRDLGIVPSSGTASVRGEEPNIDFVDTNGDGCLEAVANYTPSHQSVTRPQTLIFAFRDGRYQQIDEVGAPSHLGYYKVIDANRALAYGDLDSALELATQALKDPETGMSSDGGRVDVQRYEDRITAYAAAEAMLVHALRGEIDAMEPLLQQVETIDNQPDNPYLPAAQALWETYSATDDALAACHAMEQVVRLWGDTELVQFGSERLQIEQICPLD